MTKLCKGTAATLRALMRNSRVSFQDNPVDTYFHCKFQCLICCQCLDLNDRERQGRNYQAAGGAKGSGSEVGLWRLRLGSVMVAYGNVLRG
nr:hypothetical protein CFP56_27714 [Quercus suber]